MKFGQLTECNVSNIFFKHHAENEIRRLVLALFKKALYEVKASGQHLGVIYFSTPRLGHTIKTNSRKIQTFDPEICSILFF